MERTWVDDVVWRPESWAIFRETIRMNNDLKGFFFQFLSKSTFDINSSMNYDKILQEERFKVNQKLTLMNI